MSFVSVVVCTDCECLAEEHFVQMRERDSYSQDGSKGGGTDSKSRSKGWRDG